ncbi:lysozyme family protein, partial [Bordetella avium]|uniref:hypothetical protein n=1 Tax=Bordetella avium TaxID=521 RepID=UPI000579DBED
MQPGQRIKGGAAALVASGVLILASAGLMGFLGHWEGEGQPVVYADKPAGGLPTVCTGITKHTGPSPVVVGDYWSPDRSAAVERMEVAHGQAKLAASIPGHGRPPTFDALSSPATTVVPAPTRPR